jgi:hypothetical protein
VKLALTVTLTVTVELLYVIPVGVGGAGGVETVDVLVVEVLMNPCCIKQMSLKAFTALFASAGFPQLFSAQADMSVKPATKLVPRESPVHTHP